MTRPQRSPFHVSILCLALIRPTIMSEIFFRGDRYLKYSPSPLFREVDSMNRVSLSFRTIHPSGVLVFMIGSQGDYLSIQLTHGKLRYDLALQFKIISSVLIGNGLNDNIWHNLHIFRSGRVSEVTLDNAKQTILAEKRYDKLSASKVYFIGGLDKDLTILTQVGFDVFNGCLRVSEIDSRDPFAYLRSGRTRVMVIPAGPMSFTCEHSDQVTIEFSKPSSSLVLKSAYKQSLATFSLGFMIRTFHLDGQVLAASKDGFFLTLAIDGGRINMEMRASLAGSVLSKIVSQQSVANGLWHKISVAATVTDIFLLIDNGSRLSSTLPRTNNAFRFGSPSEVIFGALSISERNGFVGCVADLVVSNDPVNLTDTRVELLNGARQGCQLQDKCYPNPCQNSGKCDQDWKGYTCDCKGTSFYGEHCEINFYKETCAAYQAIGLTTASYCLIDTDGLGDLPPFTTLCKFSENDLAYTTVHHNKEVEFSATDGDEKFQSYIFHKLKYEMAMSQIEALIKISLNCRQFVRFRCYNAMLLNSPSGPANVVWRSRNGEVKSHWGGVTMDGEGCSCGVNQSCIKSDRLCNCDFRSNKWAEDSGFLTDKRFLPITRLDVTDVNDGFGYFDIGPLECFGIGNQESSTQQAPRDLLSHVCLTVVESVALVESANSSRSPILRTENDPPTVPTMVASFQFEYESTPSWSNESSTIQILSDRSASNERKTLVQLSILEMCLIAIAGLGIIILIAKFVLCKMYRSLYGHYKFNHELRRHSLCSDPNSLAASAIMNCSDPERTVLPLTERRTKKGLRAYWV